ncbi:DUF6233 domain-containing protein [Streptomyces sp. NPDC102394]|uniref:DUF6233 domain-containing protein n=1 Tax=Streptomyces sp. NPDC102394 TaxID=3366167 RepID=UPI0038198F6F
MGQRPDACRASAEPCAGGDPGCAPLTRTNFLTASEWSRHRSTHRGSQPGKSLRESCSVDEKRREAERRRGLDARPLAPDWLIERGLSRRNAVYVHVGDCWNAGSQSKGVGRDQPVRARRGRRCLPAVPAGYGPGHPREKPQKRRAQAPTCAAGRG